MSRTRCSASRFFASSQNRPIAEDERLFRTRHRSRPAVRHDEPLGAEGVVPVERVEHRARRRDHRLGRAKARLDRRSDSAPTPTAQARPSPPPTTRGHMNVRRRRPATATAGTRGRNRSGARGRAGSASRGRAATSPARSTSSHASSSHSSAKADSCSAATADRASSARWWRVERRAHRGELDLDSVGRERVREFERVRPDAADRVRRHQDPHRPYIRSTISATRTSSSAAGSNRSPAREPARPFDGGAARPLVGRGRERLPCRPSEQVAAEVVERAADVRRRDAAVGAVERCFDHRFAARVEVPGARESHDAASSSAAREYLHAARPTAGSRRRPGSRSSIHTARSTRWIPRSMTQPPPASAGSRNHALSGP